MGTPYLPRVPSTFLATATVSDLCALVVLSDRHRWRSGCRKHLPRRGKVGRGNGRVGAVRLVENRETLGEANCPLRA